MILRRDDVPFVPGFNSASDLVYGADPLCVDTVVCSGRVLMENGVILGEEEIIASARIVSASPGVIHRGGHCAIPP